MVRGVGGLLAALRSRSKGQPLGWPASLERCLACNASLEGGELYLRYRVCPRCRFHYTITARERIAQLVDPKSFKERYRTVSSLDPLRFSGKVPYRQRIFRDQRRTGLTEAAVVGLCRIGGQKVVLVLLDFSFLGGSMGCVVGEKVALAFELALRKHRPLVAVVTSGGTRVQEGVLSLMQMAKTTAAATALAQGRVPYLCVLGNPTTGQVYASFANLADLLIAEPGAIVGFANLRVLQEQAKKNLPLNMHTAEAQLARGMVDMVVDREHLRPDLVRLLELLSSQRREEKVRKPRGKRARPRKKKEGWDVIQLAREPGRPAASDYIQRLLTSFVEVRGDRLAGDDPSVVCGLGLLGGRTVAVIGQQRDKGDAAPQSGPAGYRKAQRLMGLAAKFGVPLLTLVDTKDVTFGLEAEEQGIAHALASTTAQMVQLAVPSLSAIIGEGGSEAALALSVADHILMLENASYSPATPEATASLMYRDKAKAPEAATSLKLTSRDCLEMGVIDEVVPEPPGGAHTNPDEAARLLQRALLRSLAKLAKASPKKLLKKRYKKFRQVGEYTSYFRAALAREIALFREEAAGRRKEKKREKGQKAEILTFPTGEKEATTTPATPRGE